METRDLLHGEIESELSNLEELEYGSEAYKIAVDGVTKLIDREINLLKLEKESEEKALDRELELNKLNSNNVEKGLDRELEKSKLKETKDEKVDRWIKNGIAIAGIVIPAMLTVWGTYKTLKFEETGTVTTMMGRGFVNKLLPKK